MPTAWEISVVETLALLDGDFKPTADALTEGGYALWLGSGISMGKVPKLQTIAEKVLRHLHQKCDPDDPNCRFANALTDVLGVAALSDDEWAKVDLAQPLDTWLDVSSVTTRLVNQYASMMDQAPSGEEPDYLLWDAVDVVATYADPTKKPGGEHLGIAALIMEGVVADVVSANWDGLVESAVAELSGGGDILNVVVLPEDVRKPARRAQLYKFHGCAILAGEDESKYRPRLVARKTQIDGWTEKGENKVIGARLVDIVTAKPTLMLGLSAQDSNIQGIFVAAQQRMSWTLPSYPPAYVFSEEKVGLNQKGLLANVYNGLITPANKADVENSALLRSFGKALLPALWLYVVGAKLASLTELAAAKFAAPELDKIKAGIISLRNQAAELSVVDAEENFARNTLAAMGRGMSLFRTGKAPAHNGPVYHPVSQVPITSTVNDPLISTSGLGEASVALGVIGIGSGEFDWTIEQGGGARPGAIRVSSPSRASEIFFAANQTSALNLKADGLVSREDDAVVVHSQPMAETKQRSPRSNSIRKGRPSLREFSIVDLVASSGTLEDLISRFRHEAVL
ncbi:SIR2 family protein [Devosia sp. MC521]|uniref:SIR2 family protein n=1 Tax=Devosia sp. MC521 TaxID=2759954 RepID=UPI0015FD1609|nr:SIR2 family protein [Devosia sp. MC521]MBJ6986274.1 SIR2 family protein [Devosia sp. MC521]QMW64243.1 SIR2 family protein [Devosia sp. MC521]